MNLIGWYCKRLHIVGIADFYHAGKCDMCLRKRALERILRLMPVSIALIIAHMLLLDHRDAMLDITALIEFTMILMNYHRQIRIRISVKRLTFRLSQDCQSFL